MPAVHRPHVLVPPGATLPTAKDLAGLSYIREGNTTNFVVFYDGSLGANGKNLADALLASCEWEYSMLQGWFGGITPASLPFNVYIDTGSFGAYHANCAATEIHCAAFSGTDADIVRLVLAAEVDEVFMAAQAKGWNCGFSHGEGLSRVLCTELYPNSLDGFASASTWLDGTRPNWVDNTEQTDRDYNSIGCAVLFLNFLRYELSYSWNAIIAAAAPTLAGVYTNLTGLTDGWARFSALMQAYYPTGTPSGVTNDNPFPLTRHSGSMIQSRFGNHGNFEVVVPSTAGGLVHFWRNDDIPRVPLERPLHLRPVPGRLHGGQCDPERLRSSRPAGQSRSRRGHRRRRDGPPLARLRTRVRLEHFDDHRQRSSREGRADSEQVRHQGKLRGRRAQRHWWLAPLLSQ